MVQNEEKEKEEIELEKIQQKIAIEKRKKECLAKTFEEKALDEDFIETEKQSMADQDEIKIETAKKIEDGRWKLKKKIELMKQKAKARAQALNDQLSQIRTQMSKDIILANRNGDLNICKKGKKDHDFRESYCNQAFVDDWVRNSECKSDEDWCYTCCEHEFGSNFVSQRDNCYDMCDRKVHPVGFVKFPQVNGAAIFKPNTPLKGDGHWVWAPKELTKAA